MLYETVLFLKVFENFVKITDIVQLSINILQSKEIVGFIKDL